MIVGIRELRHYQFYCDHCGKKGPHQFEWVENPNPPEGWDFVKTRNTEDWHDRVEVKLFCRECQQRDVVGKW